MTIFLLAKTKIKFIDGTLGSDCGGGSQYQNAHSFIHGEYQQPMNLLNKESSRAHVATVNFAADLAGIADSKPNHDRT